MSARAGFAALAFLALTGAGLAAPLPPSRPAELGPPAPAQPPSPPEPPSLAPAAAPSPAPTATPGPAPAAVSPAPAGCLARLRKAGHLVEPASPATPPLAGCVIQEPLRLLAVATGGQDRRIKLPDGPLISCALAEPLAGWIGRVAGPLLEVRTGSTLAAIRTGPGFECRGRNRQAGAQLSAHARGRAIDLAGFDFAGGPTIAVSTMARAGVAPDQTPEPSATLQAVRISACGWFTTVLGPGSDGFHADHLHLDVELHGSSDRYRICQ
ncbi:extensin family protein [uncultured Enterovirga sp.]|uniref:extensin-like domain-containing protein n=1 Tax=uncultured Enterovirga sp. TaxID=2026352 RepID=UPI0035CC7B52